MKDEILRNLSNAAHLEKIYRNNKSGFKESFNALYPEINDQIPAQIWNERLNYSQPEISFGTKNELKILAVLVFVAGLIAKLPDLFAMDPDFFYSRNVSFVVFPVLAFYFLWRMKYEVKGFIILGLAFLLPAIYMNVLPNMLNSDTVILASLHMPLTMWSVLGIAYIGLRWNDWSVRMDFLRFNGELVVLTTLILISGGLLTGITFGLFSIIDVPIEDFYAHYVIVWGLPAAPILAAFLIKSNPQLINKVSPVIARVFTPLVLVTLVVYLIAIIYSNKDPYNDREFLMVFNAMLIGVMAIIIFSIMEQSKKSAEKFNVSMLFALSVVTIIVNGIALSAILFRIMEWGITPNRMAVFGSNLLIITNLLMVSFRLFRNVFHGDDIRMVEKAVAVYLPIYTLWTIIVALLFPLIFGL